MCGCLSRTPNWGSGPQPRHVPWLAIETVTLWFHRLVFNPLTTPARAQGTFFWVCLLFPLLLNRVSLNKIILIKIMYDPGKCLSFCSITPYTKTLWLWFLVRVRVLYHSGHMWEAAYPYFSFTSMFLSPSLFLCLYNQQPYPWMRIFKNIYLFIYSPIHSFKVGGEKESERETSIGNIRCVVASHAHPNRGLGLEPRHVPRLGINLATLWLTGPHSIHWATPARVEWGFFKNASQSTPTSSWDHLSMTWSTSINNDAPPRAVVQLCEG